MISLATSCITKQVKKNIDECLYSSMIGGGKFIKEFEDKVAAYLGAKYAVAVCNGSMADMIAIAALKSFYPHKTQVILPALTFTAQAAAVYHNGLEPIFVDVYPPDHEYAYQMNLEQAEAAINENTLCIMAVHLLGKDCNMSRLNDICKRNKILYMEDCCEAFGGVYDHDSRVRFGNDSYCGTFSFFPSHTITTGEGGMIITNDKSIYDLAVKLRNHGRLSDEILDKFHFSMIGFNGKMSNLLASIGCALVEKADLVIKMRRDNVEYLNANLNNDWYASSPHCYPIECNSEKERNLKIQNLFAEGVECRKLFSSLPTQERAYAYLGHKLGDFPVAEKIGETCLFLPIHQDLTEEDLEHMWALI